MSVKLVPVYYKTCPKVAFLRSFPWKLKFMWGGLNGIVRLSKNRQARVTLCTNGTHAHYARFKVEIFHCVMGPIDSQYFEFDDYLAPLPPGPVRGKHLVISYVKWDWYALKPDTAPLVQAIETYIKSFDGKLVSG